MSSASRSSSAVRNLRSIFENKGSEQDTTASSRGRSPNNLSASNGSSDKENSNQQQPRNKVRASFVVVEAVQNMATSMESATVRRGSFGEADGDLELRKVISDQQGELGVPDGSAVESMPPSVAATPLKPPGFGQLGHDAPPAPEAGAGLEKAAAVEKEAKNPDKVVTGAEEEAGDMKPADPANVDAVSGGEALPPVAEDLTAPTKAAPGSSKTAKKGDVKTTPAASRPSAISTKAAAKPPSSAIKSPRTPLSGKAPSSTQSPIVAKKTSRTSLTAPTAASMARAEAAATSNKTKTSPPAKVVKPREVTKPVNLSSHLTAPTASSRAKHDPEAAGSLRASLASRAKPTAPSTRPAARASLAGGVRPHSRGSATSGRRSLQPVAVDGSFLDRMTRPTAASSGHRHEKIVAKSPPKTKAPAPKPKVNGHPVTPENKGGAASNHEPMAPGPPTFPSPREETNHQPMETGAAALEATPAGLSVEEELR